MFSNSKEKQLHQALISKAAQGDHLAQTELYALYVKAMYNAAYRMLEDQSLAEDVMQEAFIDAFCGLKKFEGNSTFGHWLKRIVINKCVDLLRKKRLIQIKEQEYGAEQELETEEINGDWSQFNMEDIRIAIKGLARNHKQVFQLYMIEGYDHEEIAEIMGIAASTSRSQLSRARQNLKQILEQKLSRSNVGS